MEYRVAFVVDNVGSLELEAPGVDAAAAAAAVDDKPIGVRLFFADPESGEEHYVARHRRWMHRHSAAHTIVVLEGQLDANGQIIGAGSYAHFPAGEVMHHQAAGTGACLFVILFRGPFDVELVER